jgi:polyphosphate kinase
MRDRFRELIERETRHARAGKPARILAKLNAIVDTEIIEALSEASTAGVQVDLIVRGICCLRPGVAGMSDRIRVISIIGRFLEHSRLWYFHNEGAPEYFLGSADWMPRNLDRRVEAIAPVEDVRLHPLCLGLLETCLADDRQSWELTADGIYEQRQPVGDAERSTHVVLLRDPWGESTLVTRRDTTVSLTDSPSLSPQS